MTLATAIQFRQINLPTGVRLHYAERGPQNGQPFILLHGYSDPWFSFSRILNLIPPEYRLIVPDQRGHGDSEHSIGGDTPEQFAADAIALFEALAIPAAVVIGHSLGSFVGQHMAALAPQCVGRLVGWEEQ